MKVISSKLALSTIPIEPVFLDNPVAPGVPTITPISFTFSETLSDATIAYTVATQALASTSDVDSFMTAPVYTAPTTDLSALEAFSAFSGTLANLTTASVAPTVITVPSITSPGIATIGKGDISGDVPTYTKPSTIVTAVAPDTPTLASIGFSETNALNISTTNPTAMSLTTVSYTGISDIDASQGDITTTTVDITSATQPAYNGGAVIGMAATTHALASKAITDLTLLPVIPDTPVISSITYASTSNVDSVAPTVSTTAYIAPSTTLTAFDISGITIPAATITAPNITAEGVSTLTLPDVTTNVPFYNLDNTIVDFGTDTGQQFAALATKTITDLSITAVVPDTPIAPSFTVSTITEGTVAAGSVASVTVGTGTTVSTVAISAPTIHSNTVPSYADQSLATSRVSFDTFYEDISSSNPFGDSDPGLLSITAVAPDVPTITASTVSFSEGPPTYTKPTVSLVGAPIISDLAISVATPSAPSISSPGVDSFGTAPVYTAPVFTSASTYLTEMEAGTIGAAASDIDVEHWFSIAAQLIEDAEDTELAQTHLQKIATFLNAFQMDMQNQLNIFNDANVEYQASIQEKMKEADLTLQASIQDYSLELQRYQAAVNDEVQEYQQNLAGDLQVWQTERTTDLQEYSSGIQNELNEFNKENAIYQAQLQISIQNSQLEDAEESKKLQECLLRLFMKIYLAAIHLEIVTQGY